MADSEGQHGCSDEAQGTVISQLTEKGKPGAGAGGLIAK